MLYFHWWQFLSSPFPKNSGTFWSHLFLSEGNCLCPIFWHFPVSPKVCVNTIVRASVHTQQTWLTEGGCVNVHAEVFILRYLGKFCDVHRGACRYSGTVSDICIWFYENWDFLADIYRTGQYRISWKSSFYQLISCIQTDKWMAGQNVSNICWLGLQTQLKNSVIICLESHMNLSITSLWAIIWNHDPPDMK